MILHDLHICGPKWLKMKQKYSSTNICGVPRNSNSYPPNTLTIRVVFNTIFGHSLIGSKRHGPRASYFQQPYQVWLRYFKRLWSSGGENAWVHHSCHQISLAKNIKRKHTYSNVLIIFIITWPFLRQLTKDMEKVSFDMVVFERDFWARAWSVPPIHGV